MAGSRVGPSIRAARERLGWTRETLAYRSGVSWTGIAQIESGRRQEVRTSTLVALANAMDVSVDYLVGSDAAVSPALLEHRVAIYESDDEYVGSVGAFLAEGVARSDAVLAVTEPRRIQLLREALGPSATDVTFRDSPAWYRSPIDALNSYRAFVKERFDGGATWIWIVGEPIWKGRSRSETAEWTRYESMLNLSFASSPATIVCPYDARSVPDRVLSQAIRTHPTVAEGADGTPSADYQDPERFLLN